MMEEFKVVALQVDEAANLRSLARYLDDRIIDFYKDPANEAECQAWKKERDEKERTAG